MCPSGVFRRLGFPSPSPGRVGQAFFQVNENADGCDTELKPPNIVSQTAPLEHLKVSPVPH